MIHPIVTITVFWVVFSLGFKAVGPKDMPFIVYFVTGLLPWSTFSEIVLNTTRIVIKNSHLVKKTVFPSEILPITCIVSTTLGHVILLFIVLILLYLNDIPLSLFMFQILYYYISMCVLLLGLGWMLSAFNVFHRDTGEAVKIGINFWFWASPVVWGIDMVPQKYQWLVHLNPFVYILNGYRKSLIFQQPFWTDYWAMGYFWGITIVIFVLGAYIFRQTKSDFADVL